MEKGERAACEWDYLKLHGLIWMKAGGHQDPTKNKPNAEFIENHPRYMYLLETIGIPETSELKQYTSALSNTLIGKTLYSNNLLF